MSMERQMRRARMRAVGAGKRARRTLPDGWERARFGVDYEEYRIDASGTYGRNPLPAARAGEVGDNG